MKLSTVWGHDADIFRFVADHAPIERPDFVEGDRGIGIIRGDGRLVAGAVFSRWRPQFRTLEFSGAAVSFFCLSTPIVLELGGYAFGQLNAFRISARTGVSNERAKKLLRHLGFIEEAVQGHHYGPGKHASLWRLIRPEWERKWLPRREQQAA